MKREEVCSHIRANTKAKAVIANVLSDIREEVKTPNLRPSLGL